MCVPTQLITTHTHTHTHVCTTHTLTHSLTHSLFSPRNTVYIHCHTFTTTLVYKIIFCSKLTKQHSLFEAVLKKHHQHTHTHTIFSLTSCSNDGSKEITGHERFRKTTKELFQESSYIMWVSIRKINILPFVKPLSYLHGRGGGDGRGRERWEGREGWERGEGGGTLNYFI